MAKERRDSKNRLLERGEYQKEDGRYMYRYKDTNGTSRYVYSWTLTKTDRTPKGKTPGPCLRELKRQIEKDIHDDIDTFKAQSSTLNDYFDKYLQQKKHLRDSTRSQYKCTYDLYLRNKIGSRKISDFRYSDIKKCYNDILSEHNIAISSMGSINTILIPTFKLAVRDGLLRINPAEGVLSEISREIRQRPSKREALTIQEQNAFLDFIDSSNVYKKWKSFFTVMLGTGCRVGEVCGLTWDDCDFNARTISIRRTLYYVKDEQSGRHKLRVHTPKTDAGNREIPMLNDVYETLKLERTRQMRDGFCESEVDGVSRFIFFNNRGNPRIPENVNDTIHKLVVRYNILEEEAAKSEEREPSFIPDFSSHILRHTFCTRMCESGMDIKVLQEVMGHAKIATTMDVYTSVTKERKSVSFQGIEGKVRVV